MTIAIYTCHHKPCHVVSSDIVTPLQVGAAGAPQRLPMAVDSEGDNISAKNPYYCELTGAYWIWKNATADIVGLFHYRRYLNLRNQRRKALIPDARVLERHGITRERIEEIFNKRGFDIILPCPHIVAGASLYEQYGQDHIISDLDVAQEALCEKYPEMAETAEFVLHRSHRAPGYLANMLICRKPLFDEYAAWLFDVLAGVEARIHADVLKRDAYQQRVYGFLSERLMNVFIEYKRKTTGLRVCEMPALLLTEDRKVWRHYRNKHLKHRILLALGLGKEKWEENVKSTI